MLRADAGAQPEFVCLPPLNGTALGFIVVTYNHPEVDKMWTIQGIYYGSFKDPMLFYSRMAVC